MGRIILPSTFMLLMACSGCLYVNHAINDPFSYAPACPSTSWVPPRIKTICKDPVEPEIPCQDQPLSLAEVLDLALINNTQTQLTWAQARTAAAQYAQTQNQNFPTIGGVYSYTRSRSATFATPQATFAPTATTTTTSTAAGTASTSASSSTTTSGTSAPISAASAASTSTSPVGTTIVPTVTDVYLSQYGPQLTVNYTLWDFGLRKATSDAARQALFYADWTHNRAIQTLVQTVTDDYYNYLYQKQLLRADVENVDTAKVTLNAASLGMLTGVQNVSDVLQAKTQLLQAELTLIAQKQAVQNAFATLLNDMGLPSTMCFEVQDLPCDLPTEACLKDVDTLVEIAIESRPDLRAALANLKSKKDLLKAAQRQYYPFVNYFFELGKTFFNGGLHDRYNFQSYVALNVPIFAGFYYTNNVRAAQATVEQAEASLHQTQLQITKDIATTQYDTKIAFETLHYSDAYLTAAAKEYKVLLEQYKQGVVSILNVLSAQNSLASARAQQASGIKQWYTSLADLTYATGVIVADCESFFMEKCNDYVIQNAVNEECVLDPDIECCEENCGELLQCNKEE